MSDETTVQPANNAAEHAELNASWTRSNAIDFALKMRPHARAEDLVDSAEKIANYILTGTKP